MNKIKIKKGDQVLVIAGENKGAKGTVLKILYSSNKAIVEGVNIVKKHNKQSATTKAAIESIEKPIYLCKLSITDPKTKKPSRVGFKKLKDGKKVRFLKKSGETLT